MTTAYPMTSFVIVAGTSGRDAYAAHPPNLTLSGGQSGHHRPHRASAANAHPAADAHLKGGL
jgi:hypothetical protein